MLNKGQQRIHDAALHNLYTGHNLVYEYGGAAGTGKTYTLYQICKDSGIPMSRILPMAYTGAAATVLRKKGFPSATTLHSGLYTAIEVANPNFKKILDADQINHEFGLPNMSPTITKFVPKKALPNIDLIVIDEGRMVPLYMKDIIESYGIPIIVTGDYNQLDPVGDSPAYLVDNYDILDEIMRQDEQSAIVYIAHRILRGEPIDTGNYGNQVLVIEEDDLSDAMILASNLVICGTNATRDIWNTYIRENLLGFHGNLPNYGERLICRKNDHCTEVDGIELSNGLIGFAANQPDASGFDGRSFYLDFLPDILVSPFRNLVCDYEYFSSPAKVRLHYNNPYNHGQRFEYGYCITTHLSQGSEANRGIYIDEWMGKGDPEMQKKLQYTGVTRFKESMIFVKRKRRYY